MMQTFVRPSRDLRNHYAEISEMLKDHDHVIITNHGRGESVLINIEDYAKYEEFLHQRYVAEELAKAKQQAADPDTQWADHGVLLLYFLSAFWRIFSVRQYGGGTGVLVL